MRNDMPAGLQAHFRQAARVPTPKDVRCADQATPLAADCAANRQRPPDVLRAVKHGGSLIKISAGI